MMLKFKLFIFLLLAGLSSFAQNIDLESLLSKEISKTDCRTVSLNVDANINRLYENDSIAELFKIWEKTCGETEPVLRLKIITNILNDNSTDSLIAVYFENYAYAFNIRVYNGNKPDYKKIYEENQYYYNYIPIRGNFDNLTTKLANNILEKNPQNKEEKLICLLFSFRSEEFYQAIKKKEYRETSISKINRQRLEEYRGPFTYKVSIGGWMPINDVNNTFGLNPQLGIGFGFQVEKIQFEINMNFRININDNDFSIKANSDTILTNSDLGLLIGAKFLYEVYKKEDWAIYPSFGVGWDVIDTNVEKIDPEYDEDQYHDIAAINLNFGICIMRDIFINKEIGFNVNYHYVPYRMDHNYYSHFSSDYLTFNIVYKF